jgi:hypothetical protein
MVSYLVDTNVVSEVRKSKRANSKVLAWWDSVQTSRMYLHVLTIGEIHRGIVLLRDTDPKQARFLGIWLKGLSRYFRGRLVTIDLQASLIWAEIQSRGTIPHVDALIAASAIRHDLTLVTRNIRDIHDTGVRYLNPFEAD